jgi:hypothetical protein
MPAPDYGDELILPGSASDTNRSAPRTASPPSPSPSPAPASQYEPLDLSGIRVRVVDELQANYPWPSTKPTTVGPTQVGTSLSSVSSCATADAPQGASAGICLPDTPDFAGLPGYTSSNPPGTSPTLSLAMADEDPAEARAFRTIAKYAKQLLNTIPRSASGGQLAGIWHPRQVLARAKLYLSTEELAALQHAGRKQAAQAAASPRQEESRKNPEPGGEVLPFPGGPNAKPAEDSASGVIVSLPPNAWLALTYDEGFPTLEGEFFWQPLPGEPPAYYHLFQQYLRQSLPVNARLGRGRGRGKDRSTQSTPTLKQQRSLERLHEDLPVSQLHRFGINKLYALYYTYYWGERARAYDIFQEAEVNRRLSHIASDMDGRHLDAGRSLFTRSLARILDEFDEFDQKSVIELLKLGINLERTSIGRTPDNRVPKDGPAVLIQSLTNVGMPAGGAANGGRGQELPSARSGANSANARSPGGVVAVTRNRDGGTHGAGTGAGSAGESFDLMSALQDPRTADLLQRLVLELQGADTSIGQNSRGQS